MQASETTWQDNERADKIRMLGYRFFSYKDGPKVGRIGNVLPAICAQKNFRIRAY